MDNTFSFSLIVGFILPPIIAVFTQTHWSSQAKGVVVFILCALAAIGTAWYEKSVDWHNLRSILPVVFLAALGFYHMFWKPSGIAPAIEKKATVG